MAGLTAPPSGVTEGLRWALLDTLSSWQDRAIMQNVAEVRKEKTKFITTLNYLTIPKSHVIKRIDNVNACEEHIHTDRRIIATVTIEEVIRLTDKAACATPAVCARCWAGLARAPAPVLVGALRAMPATLVSETAEKGFSSKSLLCCMNRPDHFYVLAWLHLPH